MATRENAKPITSIETALCRTCFFVSSFGINRLFVSFFRFPHKQILRFAISQFSRQRRNQQLLPPSSLPHWNAAPKKIAKTMTAPVRFLFILFFSSEFFVL
jgi:hypothetical protein